MVAVYKKIITAIVIGFAVIIAFIAADRIYPENQFWDEISTISQGTSESTASDRVILWGIAMEEFYDNPVFGVGPHNFGIRAPEYATRESAARYPNVRTLWGRSLHNIYFQTLCEQGIIGVVLFIVILLGFIKMNSKTRLYLEDITQKRVVTDDASLQEITKYYHFSKAVLFAMVCYLIGGFFYPIYEYDWFSDLLILNMLLYLIIVQDKYALLGKSDTERI